MVNFVCAKAWVTATESRWTSVFITLRRFVVATSCHDVLVQALREVKLQYRIDDSIEEQLVNIIKNDQNDFSSKNRLRLLRIVRELSHQDTRVHLTTM
eukprot:8647544-Heterocapsa_arctica.AAC.1